MTNSPTSGQLPRSSQIDFPIHLIPLEALQGIALRFQLGVERKGDGAWNATTRRSFAGAETDKKFVHDRIDHAIKHLMRLSELLTEERWDVIKEEQNEAAVGWAVCFLICALNSMGKDPHKEDDEDEEEEEEEEEEDDGDDGDDEDWEGYIRAYSYNTVGEGTCPLCKKTKVSLRFYWDMDGDKLACHDCADKITSDSSDLERDYQQKG